MSPQSPSIQSFFQPGESSTQQLTSLPSSNGDGFTTKEVESTFNSKLHEWTPRGHYEDTEIGSLSPGPGYVTFMGRVVNFYDQQTPSKKPQAAKGCLKTIVKDDSGALMVHCEHTQFASTTNSVQVKLWYAKVEYPLRLGQLVSVWTPHISNADSGSLTLQRASLVTSVFPERDNSCYFLVQEDSDEGTLCKSPLGYKDGKQLAGLLTLKSFKEGGHEVAEAKVLVCVKSIGAKKRCR